MPNKYVIEIDNHRITQIGANAIIDFYNTISEKYLYIDEINAIITNVVSPFLNIALNDLTRSEKIKSKSIDQVINFFANKHIPWAWFIMSPNTNHSLFNADFSVLEVFPDMYFNLKSQTIPQTKQHITIEIKEITTPDLSVWIQPINAEFTPSGPIDNQYQKINERLLQNKNPKLRQFVAYHRDQAVASATLFLSDNSFMLHNLADIKQFQRQGIGRALTIHLMNTAKKLGFEHCFLDSSEDGYLLYNNIGFKTYMITTAYHRK